MTPHERLVLARGAAALARREVRLALGEGYPPGSAIRWSSSGGGRQRGTVVMNCCDDRIKVRNARTGRELFIHSWRILP